jgi:hypothetical protein
MGAQSIEVGPAVGGPLHPPAVRTTDISPPVARSAEPSPCSRHPGLLAPSRVTLVEVVLVWLLLVVLTAVVFGPHVVNGGFYNDDWAFATTTRYAPGDGFWSAVQAFDWMAFRPVAAVYWPLTHELFGLNTELHLGLVLGLATFMSASLYVLLRMLGVERGHSVAIAALVLLLPATDSTRLWAASSISNLAIALYLLGTAVALRGLATTGRRSAALHAAAVALYLLSVMSYEIAAGAVLFSALLYGIKSSPRRALSRWAVDVVATGLLLVFVTSNSWNKAQPLETQLDHARLIIRQAATVFALSAIPLDAHRTTTVLTLAVITVTIALLVQHLLPPDDPARSQLRRWLLAVGGGIIATCVGYLVFVPADLVSYAPLRPGQHNRINGLAAIGYVVVIYSLLMLGATLVLRGLPHWRRWTTGFALGLSAMIALGYMAQVRRDVADWDRSWSMQRRVVATIRDVTPNPPSGTTFYTVGHPIESAPGIPVFAAPWDLSSAVKPRWDDPSLSGYPLIPGATFSCRTGFMQADNSNSSYGVDQQGLYGETYVVDIAKGRSFFVRNRDDCVAVVRRLVGKGRLSSIGLRLVS